ncbi:MAG TPA: ABC transporter permease [Gammaproteobacteria bacterium]|nr:ABC transporter permease [Gammaproteobacteria bacterium]
MLFYIGKRLLQGALTVLGVTIVVFMLQNMIASGPELARVLIGGRATPGQVHAFVKEYALNQPAVTQYGQYLWHLLHGNLGYSFKLSDSVAHLIGQTLPKDAVLVVAGIVLALILAIPTGLYQAARRNTAIDFSGTGIAFVLYSMPWFLMGLLFIAAFAVYLPWLPAQAPQGTSLGAILSKPSGLVLPVLTLALGDYAIFSRFMRSSAVDTLTQDFIRTARAKGLGEWRILTRHVLRNSLIPVVTVVGLNIPQLLSALLVVEWVFNYPGMGVLFFNAATQSDYPVELGVLLVVSIATVVGSLLADLAYAVLDPRVSYRTA